LLAALARLPMSSRIDDRAEPPQSEEGRSNERPDAD
jgi:hypothetical protein